MIHYIVKQLAPKLVNWDRNSDDETTTNEYLINSIFTDLLDAKRRMIKLKGPSVIVAEDFGFSGLVLNSVSKEIDWKE
jgi:hypothetical protein